MISRLGHNCNVISRANQLRFLVDGKEYFDAFQAAAKLAEHCLFIVGWEVDSRLKLNPNDPDSSVTLEEFLDKLCEEKPQLQIRILSWDSNFFMSFNRDLLLPLKYGFTSNSRIQLYLVNDHPDIASHHQKIIVIDDSLAMIGGYDLAGDRWDTCEHKRDDPRRLTPRGEPYMAVHDVHTILNGPGASALGDLARRYWQRTTGETLEPVSNTRLIWPEGFEPHFHDVCVAVANTTPPLRGEAAVKEIETTYLDAIRAAKDFIYIENQYLTATRPLKALANVLRKKDGPQILINTPKYHYSFLEKAALEVRRYRAIKSLQRADKYNRLRLVTLGYNDHPKESVKIHSKLMIVDDRFITVGSANLNNRSMGLDDEANLHIESDNREKISHCIAHIRNSLLAEFMDVDVKEFEKRLADSGNNIFATIDTQKGPNAKLQNFNVESLAKASAIFPISLFGDPYTPLDYDVIHENLLRRKKHPVLTHPLFSIALLILVLAVAGYVGQHLSPTTELSEILKEMRLWAHGPLTAIYIFIAVFLGSLFFVPMNALLLASALLFPSLLGFISVFLALLSSALCLFFVGKSMSSKDPHDKTHKVFEEMKTFFERKAIMAMITIRVLPVAPFTMVSTASGYFGIEWKTYLIGTFFGLLPGTAAVFWLIHTWRDAMVRSNSTAEYALIVVGVCVWTLMIWKFIRAPKTIEPQRS